MNEGSPSSPAAILRPIRTKPAYAVATCISAATLGMLAASCTATDRVPIILGNDFRDASPPPAFTAPPDGGEDASVELVTYCPSNKCPAGHTTCPGSYFPCDVDLQTDRHNCGACGAVCPDDTNGETFDCVEGRCVMTCNSGPVLYLDCDGAPDNGCETIPRTNDNCGACGVECLDPNKPCISIDNFTFACGCPFGMTYCAEPQPHCINSNTDDQNCGGCGVVCDPSGGADAGTLPPNMYFGCAGGDCGKAKCRDGFADCDGDPLNGCESLMTNENCGACGNACAAGQKCARGLVGAAFCACPPGQTFCGSCQQICVGGVCSDEICIGACRDLSSDVDACGSCDITCNERLDDFQPFCAYGTCTQRCPEGKADCNGNTADGCEVNTMTDPRNCGGCGISCDAIAGQACVGGQCVVEPCARIQDDGGAAR